MAPALVAPAASEALPSGRPRPLVRDEASAESAQSGRP